MKPIHYIGASILFLTLGCHSTPSVTRTGEVKDIIIGEKLSSGELPVSPGDEVRWINKRTAPVRVVLLDHMKDEHLSCKNNFGGWMTSSDTAKLDVNETASACFRDPGYVRYTVRMQSSTPSGEINMPGVVKVGGMSGPAVAAPAPAEGSSTTTTTTTTIIAPSNK